ncbi:hypothetical protein BGW37DRAFT_472130 [Umbelopsis sp. PMI_123]|nr:hypothetical protein BGW37DRAFT_472130 [Umbelopsis sp. PMI_123]
MNSSTEIIIVSVLASLLALSFAYLTYIVIILRRNRKNKKKNEATALENGKPELEVDSSDQIPTKYKEEIDTSAAELIVEDNKEDLDAPECLVEDRDKDLAKALEQKKKENPHLSTLTDESAASTHSQLSEPGSKAPSEERSTKLDKSSKIIQEQSANNILSSTANGKRPPQCPYKGKLQCSCQQYRPPSDDQQQLHNPTYTSAATKIQSTKTSSGRNSMSPLETTPISDIDDIKEWMSNTNSQKPKLNEVSSKKKSSNANDDDDDDTPIMTRMQALGKEVVPLAVISGARHQRVRTGPPRSTLSETGTRSRPSSPLSPMSSPRIRNRPLSLLSPVQRAPSPSVVYPNGMWNNFYGWPNTPNLQSFPFAPGTASSNLVPSYQIRTQTPPRHQSRSLASSYKSLTEQPGRRSDDYYQQRI